MYRYQAELWSVIFAIVLNASPSTSSAQAARCSASAVAAFQTAVINGFGFKVVASTATSCELVESTLIVTSPANRSSDCTYVVLKDRQLAAGWSLRGLLISPPDTEQSKLPSLANADGTVTAEGDAPPGRLIKVHVPAGRTATVSVRRIQLTGPNCSHVMDAFE